MDDNLLNYLLECSVCLEQLDGNSKVLPCQHTFCKRCLEDIVNSRKELRCPECRALFDVRVEDLPSNILLIRLLEGIKNKPHVKSQSVNSGKKSESLASVQLETPARSAQTPRPKVENTINASCKNTKQILPCAKALYSYEGKEAGDLSFKKGDIIILQRRIDQNWYHGEFNGKYGFLPANYVQIMVPLPTYVPQCIALYDFSVGVSDVKDCLTFSKDEVITVIRKVDDNWAEGKLGEKIGIFPVSFVEMNAAAKSLMKLSVNTQPGPSKVAPPTPTANSSQVLALPVKHSGVTDANEIPEVSHSVSSTSTSSATSVVLSSSTPLSLNSSPTIFASSITTASSSATPPCVFRQSISRQASHWKEKRHSFPLSRVSCQNQLEMPSAHRHSLEILSTSGGDILVTSNRSILSENSIMSASFTGKKDNFGLNQCLHPKDKEDFSKPIVSTNTSSTTTVVNAVTSTTVITTSTAASTTDVNKAVKPILYTALYNCRPQKEDELELKKGEFYSVIEKYQDGWFKGVSLKTGQCGVFPGNYVHIAKSVHQARFKMSPSSANVRTSSTKFYLPVTCSPLCTGTSSTVSTSQSTSLSTTNSSNNVKLSSDSGVRAHPRPVVAPKPKTSVATGLLEWARSVVISSTSQQPSLSVSKNQLSTKGSNPAVVKLTNPPPRLSKMPVANVTQIYTSCVPSVPAQSFISTSCSLVNTPTCQSVSDFSKNHDTGSVNCSKSRSKIPASLHVSSVSSSLLDSTISPKVPSSASPSVRSTYTKTNKHKARKDKVRESLMKKIGKKKGRSPLNSFSGDNPSFLDTSGSSSLPTTAHVRADSCPSEVSSFQKKSAESDIAPSSASKSDLQLKQPSLVRERFRCVVPYPPNSEYELELKVGDIVYVHKKREDGWYRGTLLRTGKTGLFPSSFVDSF